MIALAISTSDFFFPSVALNIFKFMIFCIESQKILLNPKLLEGKLINISLRIEENQAPNTIDAR